MRTRLSWITVMAVTSLSRVIWAQSPPVDVFPLSVHRVFTYVYRCDTTEYQLITYVGGISVDSGSVVYTVVDSTRVSDTTVVWWITERSSLVHRTRNYRNWHTGEACPDTTFLINDSSHFSLTERLNGRNELRSRSMIWSFPVQDPVQPVFRYVDASPDTMHWQLTSSIWGFETLVFSQALGLAQWNRRSHLTPSSSNPVVLTISVFLAGTPTTTGPPATGRPVTWSLEQNFPNPFNPDTRIQFHLGGAARVRLAVYDLLGREGAILVAEAKPKGSYQAIFNAGDLPTGLYVYRLSAGPFMQARRMVIVR
jgi:hypothetical protein